MATANPKVVSLEALQSALERVKTEYEEDISNIESGGGVSEDDIATESEVSAMLDEVFGVADPVVE